MAKFFIGCKVRLVEGGPVTGANRVAIGKEGRIFARAIARSMDWGVSTDVGEFDAKETCLEPIVPDGHRASEFSFTELMDRCREGVSV